MSRLDELITELCPDGVEYRKLKDVTEMQRGTSLTKKNATEGIYPVISGGTEPAFYCDSYNRENETITVAGSGVGAGYVQYWNEPIFVCDAFSIKGKEGNLTKYIYYCLSNMQDKIFATKTGGGIPHVYISSIENFVIPLPPLPVQQEIVRILDNFTELTAELTSRRKQYEYYEYKMLFDNNYKQVKLQEVCVVNQGLQIPISKRFKEPGANRYLYITVQFLKNNDDEQYYIENPDKSVICEKDDILVTRTGSTGVIITGVEGCFHNNFFKVNCNESVNKRYMYFLLKSRYMYQKMLAAASGGTVPDLPHKKFYNLEMPLPTLTEQKKIVDVLEKFEALCNDISTGIPAEIEARQKQYEYYRDKLLSFKEVTA